MPCLSNLFKQNGRGGESITQQLVLFLLRLFLLNRQLLFLLVVFLLVRVQFASNLVFRTTRLFFLSSRVTFPIQFDLFVELCFNRGEPVEPVEFFVYSENSEQESQAERESIIRNKCLLVVSLLQFVATIYHIFDLRGGNCRNQHVELFQGGHLFICISKTLIRLHYFAHEIIRVVPLFLHLPDSLVKHFHGFESFTADSQIIRDVLEMEILVVQKFRQKL